MRSDVGSVSASTHPGGECEPKSEEAEIDLLGPEDLSPLTTPTAYSPASSSSSSKKSINDPFTKSGIALSDLGEIDSIPEWRPLLPLHPASSMSTTHAHLTQSQSGTLSPVTPCISDLGDRKLLVVRPSTPETFSPLHTTASSPVVAPQSSRTEANDIQVQMTMVPMQNSLLVSDHHGASNIVRHVGTPDNHSTRTSLAEHERLRVDQSDQSEPLGKEKDTGLDDSRNTQEDPSRYPLPCSPPSRPISIESTTTVSAYNTASERNIYSRRPAEIEAIDLDTETRRTEDGLVVPEPLLPRGLVSESGMTPRQLSESIAEVEDLKDLWCEFGDAYIRFAGGLEEYVARIKQDISNHICGTNDPCAQMSISGRGQESDPAATMGEDDKERRIREMGEQIEGYKRKEEDRKIQLESSSARCRGYEDELFLLKERNDVLARTRIQLQMDWEKTADELRDLKAGGINIGCIVMKGDDGMFDPVKLYQGFEGGRETARVLLDTVGDYVAMTEEGTSTCPKLYVFLFIDVAAFGNSLSKNGIISRSAQLRDFLDGFSIADPLVSVIDVDGDDQAWRKVSAYIKLFNDMSSCKYIFLCLSKPSNDLQDLQNQRQPKLHAIRSTVDLRDDPFKQLGDDRLIFVNGLYPDPRVFVSHQTSHYTASTPNQAFSYAGSEDLNGSRPATPRPIDTPHRAFTVTTAEELISSRSNTPRPIQLRPRTNSATTEKAGSPAPSIATTVSRNANVSRYRQQQTRPPTPPVDIPPPPWIQLPARSAISTTRTKEVIPTGLLTTGSSSGSLLDQWYASQSQAGPPDHFPSPRVTSSSGTRQRSTTGIATRDIPPHMLDSVSINTKLEVPIGTRDWIPGESPPESDEDFPSVDLPHGHKTWVRRPLVLQEDSRRAQSSADGHHVSSGVEAGGIGGGGGRGGRSGHGKSGGGGEDRIHGFRKWRGKK